VSGGQVFSATMADLVDGVQSMAVDGSATGCRRRAAGRLDPCAHGTLRGPLAPGRRRPRRCIGVVSDAEGEAIGHMLGVYGQARHRRAGSSSASTSIATAPSAACSPAATATATSQGRWIVRDDPDHGRPGRRVPLRPSTDRRPAACSSGRWAETSCNLRLDR
jgi:hypothetical protein